MGKGTSPAGFEGALSFPKAEALFADVGAGGVARALANGRRGLLGGAGKEVFLAFHAGRGCWGGGRPLQPALSQSTLPPPFVFAFRCERRRGGENEGMREEEKNMGGYE